MAHASVNHRAWFGNGALEAHHDSVAGGTRAAGMRAVRYA
jgi:hypothetical protein